MPLLYWSTELVLSIKLEQIEGAEYLSGQDTTGKGRPNGRSHIILLVQRTLQPILEYFTTAQKTTYPYSPSGR